MNTRATLPICRLAMLLLLSWSGFAVSVFAQNEVQTSMYFATPTLYNPATAGSDSALNISAFNRMQWVGVTNAPQTFFAALDMPFKLKDRRIGFGASVLNDKAGLFSTTQLEAQLSMSYKLWGGRLAFGLQGGMVNQGFAASDIHIPDGDAWEATDDALPSGDVSAMTFDGAFGAYYERGWWYGGLSVQHLIAGVIDLDESAYSQLEKTYFFHAGGNIPIKRSLITLQPSVLVKSILHTTQADYTFRITYDGKFWGGATFRPGDAVVLMVGANVGTVRLGYAYDIGISPLAKASHGSHELMASYSYHIDIDKKKQHSHKSIRIL